jgi:hypothetical protein
MSNLLQRMCSEVEDKVGSWVVPVRFIYWFFNSRFSHSTPSSDLRAFKTFPVVGIHSRHRSLVARPTSRRIPLSGRCSQVDTPVLVRALRIYYSGRNKANNKHQPREANNRILD